MQLKYFTVTCFLLFFLAACEKNEQPVAVETEQHVVMNQSSTTAEQTKQEIEAEQEVSEATDTPQNRSKQTAAVSEPESAKELKVEQNTAAKSPSTDVITEEHDEKAAIQKNEDISRPVAQNIAAPIPRNSGDAVKGKAVAKKCAACHTFNQGGKNKVGPNLFGILGKKQGQGAGFKYGSYLKNSNEVWSDNNLRTWIYDSKAVAKAKGLKSKMSSQKIKGVKADDLMAYLRTLK